MRFTVFMIVDIVIALFGVYTLVSWFQMKKTGKVSQRIMQRNGLIGRPCRDKQEFFDMVYRPTLLFGLSAVAVGGIDLLCEILQVGSVVSLILTLAFLVVALWYSKQVSNAIRKNYL